MDEEKLNRWAELLLDIGKRNPLINYRDTRASTLEILAPDAERLFGLLRDGCTLEVIDPKTISDDGQESSLSDEKAVISVQGEDIRETSRKALLEKSEGLVSDGKHVLLSDARGSISAIKTIRKKGKSVLEETGINTIYAAFGFVNWTESGHSHIAYRAPLLLVPIEIVNDSPASPFFINGTGEDVVLNPTFSYKASAEFGLSLPDYADDDLSPYIDAVRKLVEPLGWDVTTDCRIGLFSFLKMNMYRDLKDNASTILQNRVVRALLGSPDPELAILPDFDECPIVKNPLVDLHNVLDADSSQLRAIEMAKSGRSFVLEGPPGTGKSQTIANIIAELLFDGKRVLFVSEKQAALNVVYNKLFSVGMGDFCLELHSYKANKKEVITELNRTLNLEKTGISKYAETELHEEADRQRELDAYCERLHHRQEPFGASIFELIDEFCECDDVEDVNYPIEGVRSKTRDDLTGEIELIDRFSKFCGSIGKDYRNNPWFGCILNDGSYAARADLAKTLSETSELCETVTGLIGDEDSRIGIDAPNIGMVEAWHPLLKMLSTSRFIGPKMLSEEGVKTALTATKELEGMASALMDVQTGITSDYDSEILDFDAASSLTFLTQECTSPISRLFNSKYRSLVSSLALLSRQGKKPGYNDALSVLQQVVKYQRMKGDYLDKVNSAKPLFDEGLVGASTTWSIVTQELSEFGLLLERGQDLSGFRELSAESFAGLRPQMQYLSERLSEPLRLLDTHLKALSGYFDGKIWNVRDDDLDAIGQRCRQCCASIDHLPNWISFSNLLEKLADRRLIDFIDTGIDAGVEPEGLSKAYKKAFLRQLIEDCLSSCPELIERNAHDQLVLRFDHLDAERSKISQAQVREAVSARRPNLNLVAAGSAVSILRREAGKKTRQMPIRKLLIQIGELAQVLKPCFLMSPLSVSTLLNTGGSIHFDTVIFDEASQIFPQDAIGSIYRGKQLIVVGDSKQMPPSSFFSAGNTPDDEEEEDDVTDFESILDLCATVLPQLRLLWHYRSRSEDLISFSNYNFYDNTLVTFPSPAVKSGGISRIFVPDGIFDRKAHTNLLEAKRIVDLVFEDAERFPDQSLGVVAFSIRQMELIERLIEERRIADPSHEEFFSATRPEPFFVKNLETVQGDERDIIIFSIAYGRDASGRVLMNFGPLNRQGGERRLNVAVTRARRSIQVVTSMRYTDIDLQRTSSEGARLLRAYLDYAENGNIALQRQIQTRAYEQFDSPFELEVCDYLRRHGYHVDTQVGCSGFRIDLAVKRGEDSDYVLAIECDGATYHSAKNARDRDRLRQSVLEHMGWTFYRIWSTDWFRNPVVERESLIEAVERALENRQVSPAATNRLADDARAVKDHKDVRTSSEGEKASSNTGQLLEESRTSDQAFPEYKCIDIEDYVNSAPRDYSLLDVIQCVLRTEAPLSEDWLLQRIAFFFGRQKATKNVRDQYLKAMWNCAAYGISRHDGFVFLDDDKKIQFRIPGTKRSIDRISLEELAAGMRVFVEQNTKISKDSLFLAVARVQGCHRMGPKVKERLENALKLADDLAMDMEGNVFIKQ